MENKRKVMIVDDLEVFRKQIRRLPLWKNNVKFELAYEASDGVEALIILDHNPVDLIITDIKMPRMDGMALLKEVRMKGLPCCVVFLSDYGEFHFAKEAIQNGIFDYLVKPVKEEEMSALLVKVEQYLSKSEEEALDKKRLEEKVLETVSLYYPLESVKLLLEKIKGGKEEALKEMDALIDTTYFALGEDLLKTGLILEKVCFEILEGTSSVYPWFFRLYSSLDYREIKFSRHGELEAMKKEATDFVKKLLTDIRFFMPGDGTNALVRDIVQYILKNMEEKFTLEQIAAEFFLTKNHIGDVFKEDTGLTVGEYLFRVKIQRAKMMLLHEDLRSYEIAEILGYQSAEYFGRQFKKATGLTPSEYRSQTSVD